MEWKDLANDVAKIAPALGAAIGGPAGAGIGSLISAALGCGNSPSEVQQALTINPDAAVKIKEIEGQVQLATIAAAASQVQSVNQTLQADARGDSWWQKNHHAYESSFALLMVAAIFVGLPLLKIPVPLIDPTVWMMIGAILGVTAWQHGEVNKKIAGQ
jgi:hypothetical protein